MEPIEFYIENNSIEERVTMAIIERTVCQEYGLQIDDLHSKSRAGMIPTARFMCYYFARKYDLFRGVQHLASYYKQNHSNVLYGVRVISNITETDYYHKNKLNSIKNKLNTIN